MRIVHHAPAPAVLGERAAFGPGNRAAFSAEDDATIIDLVNRGAMTRREIAARLGRKYGVVEHRITFLRARGLLPKGERKAHSPNGARGSGFRFEHTPLAPPSSIRLRRKAGEPEPLTLAAGVPVTMENVASGQCRWPVGEPDAADFRLCGHAADGPWCDHHRARVFERAVPSARVEPSRPSTIEKVGRW